MVYTDSVGNVFLGDAVVSGGTGKLTGCPMGIFASEWGNLFSNSGLQYRQLITQSLVDEFDSSTGATYPAYMLGLFASAEEIIDDRYRFCLNLSASGSMGFFHAVSFANDLGFTQTNNSGNVFYGGLNTNQWLALNQSASPEITSSESEAPSFQIGGLGRSNEWSFVAVADNSSLGLVCFYYSGTGSLISTFMYAGLLADVNPNYAYYNSAIETKSIFFHRYNSTLIVGGHRINSTAKLLLQTGDAQYPIVCADAQTPTSQWATDMYVFDNNAALGYPAIGRVRNLLLAQGTYTIGKPVRIQGTAMPDNGFNAWLPVGSFGGKTVLMRCYSSMSL